MARYIFLLLPFIVAQCVVATFRFSTYFSDHMVLQKGTKKQIVFGKSSKIGDTVSLMIVPHNGHGQNAGSAVVDQHGNWMIKINYNIQTNYGPYMLNATSSLGEAVLHDVLFGDVWVCSGQSNMEYAVYGLANSTLEVSDAHNYPLIRIFKAANVQSDVALEEFKQITTHWNRAQPGPLSGFSAVCWLYGKYLSQHLNYPLGLIETNWGGTPIEAWSSPDALSVCDDNHGKRAVTPSSLWNAMITPLLKVPIYGAIWYQGESNALAADKYSCQFPAMISDWRSKFNNASDHGTNGHFPFGFVQLAPWRAGEESKGFPEIRWSQTAGYGHVPNAKMTNTFMAVAMDLPDFASPYGSIHPRFKHDVAARLVLSALAVAYHQHGVDYQGPYPSSYTKTSNSLEIEYSQGNVPLDIRNNKGFEVCCSTNGSDCSKSHGNWQPAPVSLHDTSTVTLSTTNCNGKGSVAAVRYAWRESPCDFKRCAVYGHDNNLPGPPFFHPF